MSANDDRAPEDADARRRSQGAEGRIAGRIPDCVMCDDLADDAAPCRHCGLGMWGGR